MIIFAKQYTCASCLPEVLLSRMNVPVFSARTQSPFTVGKAGSGSLQDRFSSRSFQPLEIAGHYLTRSLQQKASHHPVFSWGVFLCCLIAAPRHQTVKRPQVVPWNSGQFLLNSDSAFIFFQVINGEPLGMNKLKE